MVNPRFPITNNSFATSSQFGSGVADIIVVEEDAVVSEVSYKQEFRKPFTFKNVDVCFQRKELNKVRTMNHLSDDQ